MDLSPFTQNEFRILEQFITWKGKESLVLRSQLDSLRYTSSLYKPKHFLGITYRAKTLSRSKYALKFKVGWGAGSEDWQLGDRRPFTLNDVVIRLSNGTYLCSKLEIKSGLINTFSIVGSFRNMGEPIVKYSGNLRDIEPKEILFTDLQNSERETAPPLLSSIRSSVLEEIFHPQVELNKPSAIQEWILSLDEMEIPLTQESGLVLPLRIRRAKPATEIEIESFERNQEIKIPGELRDFWRVTNGASFFGNQVFGTYDALVAKRKGRINLLFIMNVLNKDAYTTIELYQSNDSAVYNAKVNEYDFSAIQPRHSWNSLQDYLKYLYRKSS